MNKYIILSEKSWHKILLNNLGENNRENWTLIDSKDNFTPDFLKAFNSTKIFIPHW